MEADWEIDIGPGRPMIDAHWAGLVDLRQPPELAHTLASRLPEVAHLSGLANALVRLNSPISPGWTAKCDVWPVLDSAEFDPDEMDAPPERAAHAWGAYIDLLPASEEQWSSPAATTSWCKEICSRLHDVPIICSRVDLVVRHAVIARSSAPDMDLGITAYLTACGSTANEANQVLNKTLERFVDALCLFATVE